MGDTIEFDDVLVEVGEFGLYQKLILFLVLLPAGNFPCAFGGYNHAFMAFSPKHHCHIQRNNTQNNNVSVSGSCYIEFNNSRVLCEDGWDYNFPKGMTSVVSEWDLVCNRDFLPTLTLVLFFASGVIGNYILGYTLDRWGRKLSHFIFLLVISVFGIGTAFSNSFIFWLLMRIGVGFTIPAISYPTFLLAIEMVGPDQRNICNLLQNFGYSLGMVVLSGIMWFVRDWRYMSLATSVPLLGFFLLWGVTPESNRWLLSQKKYGKLEHNMRKLAKYNAAKFPEEMFQQLKVQNNIRTAPEGDQVNYGCLDLFRHQYLRKITIISSFIWFVNSGVYVGLTYYAPVLSGDEHLNFLFACLSELLIYPVIWLIMDRVGRRVIVCVSMVVGGLACIATFLVQSESLMMLILFCVGKFGVSAAFLVVPLMVSEIYPTVIRGVGIGLNGFLGMLGPVFIPLINYLGTDLLILPLIIMGVAQVLGGLSACFLPETLGCRLPQTIEDIEGKQRSRFRRYNTT